MQFCALHCRANMPTKDRAPVIADAAARPAVGVKTIPKRGLGAVANAMSADPNDSGLGRAQPQLPRLEKEINATLRPSLLPGAFR